MLSVLGCDFFGEPMNLLNDNEGAPTRSNSWCRVPTGAGTLRCRVHSTWNHTTLFRFFLIAVSSSSQIMRWCHRGEAVIAHHSLNIKYTAVQTLLMFQCYLTKRRCIKYRLLVNASQIEREVRKISGIEAINMIDQAVAAVCAQTSRFMAARVHTKGIYVMTAATVIDSSCSVRVSRRMRNVVSPKA